MIPPEYLAATPILDWQHQMLRNFVRSCVVHDTDQRRQAIVLYYNVRDFIRYDPYRLDLTPAGMKASTTLTNGYGWCVPKAVLLAACCRALGIPARLGFGDVRNHMSTKRMREVMQTDVFYWHGFTDIYLDGSWVKATPAFNRELCERLGIAPLDFDGTKDSILHPYDRAGNKYMEYLRDRGRYDDLPLKEITATFSRHYGTMMQRLTGDFASEIVGEARETPP